MKKIYKNLIFAVICFAIAIELGALIGEGVIYTKYKVQRLNFNGKIISKIDNLINFSGMAAQ